MDRKERVNPEANRPTECAVCEAMLPDAADGLLNEAEQRAFDKHVATCAQCSQELEEARRGAAWLHMLKGSSPEPSPLLLTKILAQTTGSAVVTHILREEAGQEESAAGSSLYVAPEVNLGPRVQVVRVRESVGAFLSRKLIDIFSIQKATMHFQPRLAMTAAMAFFSVALTLNMTGVKLGSLKASNLRPSALRRSVADTSASAMRSFQNMRVVYQFESKLEDIRDTGANDHNPQSTQPTPSDISPAKDKGRGSDQNGQRPSPRGHSSLEFPLVPRNANVRGV